MEKIYSTGHILVYKDNSKEPDRVVQENQIPIGWIEDTRKTVSKIQYDKWSKQDVEVIRTVIFYKKR